MLSPCPRKVFLYKSCCSQSTSSLSPRQTCVYPQDVDRPMWYEKDDEAIEDLGEALTGERSMTPLPQRLPAFASCCSSVASTALNSPSRFTSTSPSSGQVSPQLLSGNWLSDAIACENSPLSPSIISPTSSPDAASQQHFESECGIEPTDQDQPPQCPPGALDKSSWVRARKLFVGGIPQKVDENDLYRMCSTKGKVKKAWLQMFNGDSGTEVWHSSKKHRGFGFVIFHEKKSIDKILGGDSERIINFDDGVSLEFRQSFQKNKACTTPGTIMDNRKKSGSPIVDEKGSQEASPTAEVKTSSQGPARQEALQPGLVNRSLVPPASQLPLSSGSSTTSPLWQHSPQPMVTVIPMPWIPVFPFAPSPQSHARSIATAPLGNSLCPPPVAAASIQPQPEELVIGTAPPQSVQYLSDVLLGGQVPKSAEELKKKLEEAEPHCYED